MMNDIFFLSIIVPVYNVKDYLEECLESIIKQLESDIEVIIVDDGSTDGSAEICEKYGKMSNISVIHRINGGLGCARNSGLKIAKGEWILFVDSDDVLEWEAINTIKRTIKENPNIYLFNFRYKDWDGNELTLPNHREYVSGTESILCDKNSIEKYEMMAGWAVWKLVINRHLIFEPTPLLFLDNVRNGEDTYWILKLFSRAGKIKYCDDFTYRYRLRNGSLSEHSPVNSLKWMTSLENTYLFFISEETSAANEFSIHHVCARYIPHTFWSASLKTKREWKDHHKMIKEMSARLYADEPGIMNKTARIVSRFPKEISFWCYIIFYKLLKISGR